MLDVFNVLSPALPKGTRVVGFRGEEGISRLYAFELHLTIHPDAADGFDLANTTGEKGSLLLDRQDGRPPFTFHGIFSEASIVHHQPDGRALVRATLVPRLWRLTQTHHSRIFTQQSIPDILKTTLEDGGLTSSDYSIQLSRVYPAEEHVCQYQESSFDFISRWMEREGLFYFFEQGDAGEKLIITDSKAAHEDLVPAPVRFFSGTGADVSARECLQTLVCRRRSLPASVRLKDHDYTKPALDVSGKASVSSKGVGEISVHGSRFFTPEEGKRLAQLRAEAILAREQVFTASGTAFYLRAGYTFSLQDHPRSNFDAKYLVTEVEHQGNQSASTPELRQLTGLDSDQVYRVDVTAVPASVQFRAELRTPWPRIYGTEHGIVDGAADSDYAQLDDHGRYNVRFAFDESDLGAGKASTRVRMMQPHGGGVEGWHFPLRKGTEVLFTFLGGDPDRPVIAGVVPSAVTPSPVTKANHTQNVIQTGGRNRFELEDKQGFQRITLSTPHKNSMIRMGAPNDGHEMIIRTDGATILDAGGNWDVKVDGNLTEDVDGTTDETYTKDHTTQSWAKRTIEIGGVYRQACHSNVVRHVYGTETFLLDGNQFQTIGGLSKTTVGGGLTVNVTGDQTTDVSGTVTIIAPCVRIKSPSVTIDGAAVSVKGSGFLKAFSGASGELFGSKNTAGGQKFDGTLIKLEATDLQLTRVGLKVDSIGFKAEHCSFKTQLGPEAKAAPLTLKNAALSVASCGFCKLA